MSIRLDAAEYIPSWSLRPQKPSRLPGLPSNHSTISVTHTSNNSMSPIPSATVPSFRLQGSPNVGGRSPTVAKHFPVRMSPSIMPSKNFMNPYASEFVPGRDMSSSAAGLEALPISTADLEEERHRSHATPTPHAVTSSGPTVLVGKTEREIVEISQKSALKVGAMPYVPKRTVKRMLLTSRDSPTMSPTDAAKDPSSMLFNDLWCLFYLPSSFGESIKEETYNPTLVFRFENIPSFWKVFNNIPLPSSMQLSTLYLFRDGIDPKWEDPTNRHGGIVKVKVPSNLVNEAWELLLCRTVGDTWSSSVRDAVTGVALKVRERAYLLEVWVKHESPELMKDIADLWQSLLGGAFAAVYFSHTTIQERSAAAALAKTKKLKKRR